MHKQLIPATHEAQVARMSSFNDLEQGNTRAYDEYLGYSRVADVLTQAMMDPSPSEQAMRRALEKLQTLRGGIDRMRSDAQVPEHAKEALLTNRTAIRWGITQLETLLS